MTVPCFVDTNVFIYALSNAESDLEKKVISRSLLRQVKFGISVQVLNEFVSAASKPRLQIDPQSVHAAVSELLQFPIAPLTVESFLRAREIQAKHQISFWDAAIVGAANSLGAKVLYTEDLNHGQLYEGVMALNPYKASAGIVV